MSETPARRPTGSIPLSWARPAEDVSADVDAAGTGVPVAAVVAFIVVAIAAGLVLARRVVPEPSASTPSASTSSASTSPPSSASTSSPSSPSSPPTPPASSAPTPTPPPQPVLPAAALDPTVAPEDDDTLAAPLDAAAKKAAQLSLKKARLAARDDDNAKAIALVEDAVAKDPRCYECWSTLAFLRGKVGDVEGQRVAKRQARALKP
jgi:hypothetical protein